MTTNRTYWEEVAETTRQGCYITAIERRLILFSSSMLDHTRKALEIGCEGGRWSRLLADHGWNMTCADVDEKVLRVCQERIPEATCVLTTPESTTLPTETASVDLLLCVEVRPVIQSEWFGAEAARVLQNGGLIVGVVWNSCSLRALIHRVESRLRGSVDFCTHSYSAWRRKFQKHGFQFIKEEGFCWLPFKRTSNSKLVPFFASVERILGLGKLPRLSPWVMFVARRIV
jgi:2-polyprenyl-3-methyl-5-hydroxy-6-metoxy-1,4-benzoquinol methylase